MNEMAGRPMDPRVAQIIAQIMAARQGGMPQQRPMMPPQAQGVPQRPMMPGPPQGMSQPPQGVPQRPMMPGPPQGMPQRPMMPPQAGGQMAGPQTPYGPRIGQFYR